MDSNKLKPNISIVTPLHSRPSKTWINYLCKILPEDDEAILVGNVKPMRSLSQKNIMVVNVKGNRSRARNIGISMSRGDIILLLDSDQFPSKNLFREVIELHRKGYDAVILPEIFIGIDLWGKAAALWKTAVQSVDKKYGCIPRVYSRALLSEVGVFNEDFKILEDLELYLRARRRPIKITWSKSPLYHVEDVTLSRIVRKSRYYMHALFQIPNIHLFNTKLLIIKYLMALKCLVKAMSLKEKSIVKLACIALLLLRMTLFYLNMIRNIFKRIYCKILR